MLAAFLDVAYGGQSIGAFMLFVVPLFELPKGSLVG